MMLATSVDQQTMKKINRLASQLGTTKSACVRMLIKNAFEEFEQLEGQQLLVEQH
jgi:predicted DNA-binding protein